MFQFLTPEEKWRRRGTLWDKEVAIKRLKHRKMDNQSQMNIQKEVEVMM